jgi:hypothetical protein
MKSKEKFWVDQRSQRWAVMRYSSFFPDFLCARDHFEQRMRIAVVISAELLKLIGISLVQFIAQPVMLEGQLSPGDRYFFLRPRVLNLPPIEAVPSFLRLRPHRDQIAGDGLFRVWVISESFQLRMVPISLRFSEQDVLSQKAFSPQGHQAGTIEVFRV